MQCVDPRFDEFGSLPEDTPQNIREAFSLFRPIDREYLKELRDTK
jgi:hypothetical protein